LTGPERSGLDDLFKPKLKILWRIKQKYEEIPQTLVQITIRHAILVGSKGRSLRLSDTPHAVITYMIEAILKFWT